MVRCIHSKIIVLERLIKKFQMLRTGSGGVVWFWKNGMEISTENKNKTKIRYKNNITFRLCWCHLTGSHANFHGSWCCKRSCWCPWSMLLLDTMWMSMVCATGGHADVPDLYCWEGKGRCLWSQLLTKTLLKSKTHAAGNHVEICDLCYWWLLWPGNLLFQ